VPLTDPLLTLKLVSGVEWQVNFADMLLALGVLLLLLEIFKGARPGSKYLTDHLLSLIVFAGAAAEFVLWPKFGTSTFFLLALMAMVDFFGGIALSARRAAPPATDRTWRRAPRGPEAPDPEARIDPAPAAPAPAAASVAEPVPSDHAKPKPAQNGAEPSPTISPELQPGGGPAASPESPQH
jgi:hypothetical protein